MWLWPMKHTRFIRSKIPCIFSRFLASAGTTYSRVGTRGLPCVYITSPSSTTCCIVPRKFQRS